MKKKIAILLNICAVLTFILLAECFVAFMLWSKVIVQMIP